MELLAAVLVVVVDDGVVEEVVVVVVGVYNLEERYREDIPRANRSGSSCGARDVGRCFLDFLVITPPPALLLSPLDVDILLSPLSLDALTPLPSLSAAARLLLRAETRFSSFGGIMIVTACLFNYKYQTNMYTGYCLHCSCVKMR